MLALGVAVSLSWNGPVGSVLPQDLIFTTTAAAAAKLLRQAAAAAFWSKSGFLSPIVGANS